MLKNFQNLTGIITKKLSFFEKANIVLSEEEKIVLTQKKKAYLPKQTEFTAGIPPRTNGVNQSYWLN